jgi:hypothetical protein
MPVPDMAFAAAPDTQSPLWDENTEILILGTLPSDTSLAAGKYYANPGNDSGTCGEMPMRSS